jgi:hypothetical protein
MTLPYPPPFTIDLADISPDGYVHISKVQDVFNDISQYLYDILRYFPNAVGSAVDPSRGQGGAGALTVTDVVTNIIYTASSTTNIDDITIGMIDISFTLPDRAVAALVYYKHHGDAMYHTSYAAVSPWSLSNLSVGILYDIYLVGIAANGNTGPASTVTEVVIPLSSRTKTQGLLLPDVDDSFEIPLMIPGPIGQKGQQGPQGPSGLDGIDGEETWFFIQGATTIIP